MARRLNFQKEFMNLLDLVRDEKNKQKLVDQWVESLEPPFGVLERIHKERLTKHLKSDKVEST
jgi:hypothetical protein